MESKINENKGLLSATIIVVAFGLALFAESFLLASAMVLILCVIWITYATIKMERAIYKKIELRVLALKAAMLLLLVTSLLLVAFLPPITSSFSTLLGVLILITTGIATITIIDARGQPTSDFFRHWFKSLTIDGAIVSAELWHRICKICILGSTAPLRWRL